MNSLRQVINFKRLQLRRAELLLASLQNDPRALRRAKRGLKAAEKAVDEDRHNRDSLEWLLRQSFLADATGVEKWAESTEAMEGYSVKW